MKDDPGGKRLFLFGNGQAEGGNEIKHLIGGKGASLAEMTRAGLPVPPGFTISTQCCSFYHTHNRTWPPGLQEEILAKMAWLESVTGRAFGKGKDPLLVAVRSGAAESMPGMMDTILNVGINPECVRAASEKDADVRAAWESYRHFLVTFSEAVGGVKEEVFAAISTAMLKELDLRSESELNAEQMEELCTRFRTTYQRHSGRALPTEPTIMLFQAIEAVFQSWNSARAVAYRRLHDLDDLPGTAVTVQAMCPSEVSGVLFTAHPVNPALDQMVIEASKGLGELVVLGKVTPDRVVIDRTTDRIVELKPAFGDQLCLGEAQIRELVQLGRRIEAYFEMPCDIEWGLVQGQFYLLQARAIKYALSPEQVELEKVRLEEINRLRQLAEPQGTVWSRISLAEVLPEPTPMTWAIIRQFMSSSGGFGQMYRDLGFYPDPELEDIGIFDLVCGRPYCNLSREPRMQYRMLPFEHPFDELHQEPKRALDPQARFNPQRANLRFWLLVPVIFAQLFRSALRLRKISRTFAEHFRNEIVPAFVEETSREANLPLDNVDSTHLLQRLQHWIKRTLFDFARQSLKPTVLAAVSMSNLERTLARLNTVASLDRLPSQTPPFPETLEKARAKIREAVMHVRPAPEADLAGAIRQLANGQMSREDFLKEFGHRGPDEMELASPRWAENPDALNALLQQAAEVKNDQANYFTEAVGYSAFSEYKLTARQRQALEKQLETLREFLALRETAKHHLMRGYFLIRRYLVELDKRYQLDGGIFFLTPEELPELLAGHDFSSEIAERKKRRSQLLSLSVPPVLFSDDLEAIGRAEEISSQSSLQGVPLSAGLAEGPALVLEDVPESLPNGEPYVLVCPTTDPAWTPLFVRARAIVMETGGMLSHGAIVAREFGLPAVAGLPGIHRRLKTGQRIRVDGSSGRINVLEEKT